MKLRTRRVGSLLADMLIAGAATAQTVGEFRFLSVPADALVPGRKGAEAAPTPIGNKDHVFAIAPTEQSTGGERAYKALVYKAGTEVPAVSTIHLPVQKGREALCGFLLLGDGPCTLTSAYDAKTGRMAINAQRFDAQFAPLGGEVPIGEILFDKASFTEALFELEVFNSPDGSKALVYFDQLRTSKSERAVMCWVMDVDLNPLWKGAYRIPANAFVFDRQIAFDNDGNVVLAVDALMRDAGGGRWERSASPRIFKLHGASFAQWDFDVPDALEPSVDIVGDHIYASAYARPGKKEPWQWHLVELDKDLKPLRTATGRLTDTDVDRLNGSKTLVGNDGSCYLMADMYQNLVLVSLSKELAPVRSKEISWRPGTPIPMMVDDKLFMVKFGLSKDVESIRDGRKINQNDQGPRRPLLISNLDGTHAVAELIPAEVTTGGRRDATYGGGVETLVTSGMYVETGLRGKEPGLLLVTIGNWP